MVREICKSKGILYPKNPVSVLYFNRYCPFRCPYCGIRKDDAKPEGELSKEEWFDVFDYLKEEFGISFFLVLGNEPLYMGEKLLDILSFLNGRNYLYNFYTTFPDSIDKVFLDEVLKTTRGVSGGIDVLFQNGKVPEDTIQKSRRVYTGLLYSKDVGVEDVLGLVTLGRYNVDQFVDVIKELSSNEIFVGTNVLHYRPKGLNYFDFFSEYSKYFALERNELLRKQLEKVIEMIDSPLGKYIQFPKEYYRDIYLYGIEQGYKCRYGMGLISVDSDGGLRVCGYRIFDNDYKVSIFDIMKDRDKLEEFINMKYESMKFCYGCFWGLSWLIDYNEKKDVFRFDLKQVKEGG